MKKLLTWLAVIIVALWVFNNPAGAAALLHQAGHALSTLASDL